MTRASLAAVLALVALAPVSGCGGGTAPPAASPSSTPAAPGEPGASKPAADEGAPRREQVDTDGEPSPSPVSPTNLPNETKKSEVRAEGERARRDFDRAAREVETSDCATACRALASMERAATHLCDLAASSTDGTADCHDAERRLRAAKDRVRAACGVCPGGPSLERPPH